MTILKGKGSKSHKNHSHSTSTSRIRLPDDDQNSSIELRSINDYQADEDIKSSFKSLFTFTTKKHISNIVPCILFASLAAFSNLYRQYFTEISLVLLQTLGLVFSQQKRPYKQVSKWCIAITILGGAVWLFEGLFLCSWMVFGELQARSVRERMFAGMLEKDLEWFDLRKDGIGSLLIRIETQIRELQLSTSQPLGFLLFETASALTFPVAGGILYLISRKMGPAIEAQKVSYRKLRIHKYSDYSYRYCQGIQRTGPGSFGSIYQQLTINNPLHDPSQVKCISIWDYEVCHGGYLCFKALGMVSLGRSWTRCRKGSYNVLCLFDWNDGYRSWFNHNGLSWQKECPAGATLKSIMNQVDRGGVAQYTEGLMMPKICSGDIEVNDVTFAYPSNRQHNALVKTTFFFPAGETTFVVGKSGSGKSTLGNLLLKFYEPQEGSILIDGQRIQDLDTDWLRRNITLVLQQSVVFNETVRKNIEFGKEGITNEVNIMDACSAASLEQVIADLPDGLDTLIGSKERQLSGGQKQRVALARARLRDAPILILDEGTSALDLTNRIKIMDNIREWRKGKTTIIVTHDISQILDDDYVYVMEESRVVQEGYRRKLSAKANGTFATFSPLPELPVEQSIDLSNIRRNSDPETPLTGSFEDFVQELTPRFSTQSTLYGPNAADRRSLDISNRRLSLGYASIAYANDLQSNNIWTSGTDSSRSRLDGLQRPTSQFQKFKASDSRQSKHSIRPPRYQDAGFQSIPENPSGKPSFDRSSLVQRHLSLVSTKTNRDSKVVPIDSLLEYSDDSTENADESKEMNEMGHLKPDTLTKILKTVWPMLNRKERIILSGAFAAAFIVAVSTPAFAIIYTKLLDTFYQKENRNSNAFKWSLILLGIAIIDGIACFFSHYALERAGQAWVSALRVEALKRILAQPKSWFEESRNSPGRLNEVLDRNSEEMRNLVGRFAGIVFTAFFMLWISIIWAFVNTWKLTLVSMATGPVIYAVTKTFNRVSGKWENKCNYASEMTTSIFSETFSNIKVVRAFTLETYFEKKHTRATEELYKVGRVRANYSGLLWGLTDAMSFFITATIFYYATVLITKREISIATALQTVNLLLFGISNSTNMLAMIPQINSSRVTATHMLELANLDSSSSHENKGNERLSTIFPIKFNRLSFTYPARPETRTISSFSLSLNPNSTTALVGASGSGKSTIATLLIGLYPPDTSTPPPLTFNRVSITNCHIPSLRAFISLVPQTPILFPATIFHNIIYGLPESSSCANLPSAIASAKDAGVHEFITSLPQSYNTMVGDGGQELSGGQAQRIVISRALVRKPKLLILDEATSGLDGGSAEVIRETVQKLKKREGMATLVVSHTAEMMKMAGRVVVMEEGKIVESGGFDELKNRVGGRFGALVGDDSRDTAAMEEENDIGEGSSNAGGGADKEGGLGIRIPGYEEVEFHTRRDTPIRDARRRDTWLRQKNH
ncbi:uncharacterized protein EAF02_000782 [Botrytis sinoallii]|uniref:uncharacterized protein n=1 Tax=Botrytis sinoallii TaxID=1463999 RepID=UPI0018FFEDEB|nr:uncharacterized protein EAF02_000782 [Botrytis sinoallii]KAF7893244.1 hypothetical protein EAF02_000782 [Botrytis sinoallii]